MNELLKQTLTECGFTVDGDSIYTQDPTTHVNLLVKKIVEMCSDRGDGFASYPYPTFREKIAGLFQENSGLKTEP